MSRSLATATLFGLIFCPAFTARAQSRANTSAARIDMSIPYSARDYDFLRNAVGNHTIVQLGESIHLTDEFPRVRVRLVRYMHETMGFDVIALEGSQVNAWLAMERLYAAPGDTAAIGAAQAIAWFPLWDTSAMRELMSYVAATQRTASPLYLASFDMQAGQSRVTGDSVFVQLFRALSRFSPEPADARGWATALIAAKQCSTSYSSTSTNSAIDGIQQWIETASTEAARMRPASHVAAMRMLPRNLRELAALCDAQRSSSFFGARQVARDSIAAINVFALRDTISASHKIITWGHHSHVYYNTTRGPLTSMGQRLRAADSSSVYTIGLFAGNGTSYDIADADMIPIIRRHIPSAADFSADRPLQAVAKATGYGDYFLDLSRLDARNDGAFFVAGVTRFEPLGRRRSILARDFDGAIYVDQVSPPRLLFTGSLLPAIAGAKGVWIEHKWLIILLLVVTAGLATRARIARSSRRAPRQT